MNKNLALSEEYEKNPGLNIQKLRTQLELMINKTLLVTILTLLLIAICSTVAISLTTTEAFEVMVTVCFSVNSLILFFLLYAGFTSIKTLRSIYNDGFSECVIKVGIILTVFMICFLVKAGFGVVYLSKIFENQDILLNNKD